MRCLRGVIVAKFYTEGNEIVINTNRKPFAAGSEGQLYIVGDLVNSIV